MSQIRLALLGDPVSHSRSPAIHAAMLELADLSGDYTAIRADVITLQRTLSEMRSGEWHGLNVTMPLKGEAASRVDRVEGPARRAGSVNTVAREAGSLVGWSTDASAMRDLSEDPRFAESSLVRVFGAGQTAAATLAGVRDGVEVILSARHPEQAEALVGLLGRGAVAHWDAHTPNALVINTTPIGMSGDLFPTTALTGAVGFIDLPYSTSPTPASTWARAHGIPCVDGEEFLIRQAIASFEVWTGVRTDLFALLSLLRNV